MSSGKKKPTIISEKGTILYQNYSKDVTVYNDNGGLYFESTSSILDEDFKSYDCSEGVAVLMRLKSVFDDDKFWELKTENSKYDISSERTLYWLSGGNREWVLNNTYAYSWEEVSSIFEHKFSDILHEIVEKSETLNDIKEGFMNHLNLPVLYEFALNNDLI